MLGIALLLAATLGESRVRELLAHASGFVQLPPEKLTLTSELHLPDGSRDLVIDGRGSVLILAPEFQGRAAIVCSRCTNVRLRNLNVVGNRKTNIRRLPIAPYDRAFADFYAGNGVLIMDSENVTIERSGFSDIAAFPILITRSKNVHVDGIGISDSGSVQPNGRNNTTGGILLEEGTTGFTVTGCRFTNVFGNGIWTHSRYESPRNAGGLIRDNKFDYVARDAIQVGHATNVRVEENTGTHIGYPHFLVDPQGMPVAIDTAGNVDKSAYTGNRFHEINGKCVDLDGFHDGEVSNNSCVNQGKAADYPNGHFGIVFNNTNPDMQSRNVRVTGNTIDGAKYGGIFVIGEGHTIANNNLVHLNLAHCNETPNCIYLPDEPDLLRTGVYFGRKAERPDPAKRVTVRDNVISGFGMEQHCFGFAPGITPKQQNIERNRCTQ